MASPNPQPPNGFVSGSSEAANNSEEAEEATIPMLKIAKLNGSSNAIKVKPSEASNVTSGTTSTSRLLTSKKQLKVTQCLVLCIILALVAILCSVFIKPDIYFSEYGK